MRAVNLIPAEARGSGSNAPLDVQATVYAVLGVLGVGLILMIIYVTTGNTIADRQVQIASLKQQVAQTQAALGQLTSYVQFQQLAQSRAQTVKQIADTRYDWASTFGQLARVIPANTTLNTLNASISPTTGGGTSGLRGDIIAPAVELNGCTRSQLDVARLMSRLRLVQGVTRVTLASSAASSSSTPAGSSSSTPAAGSGTASATGCGRGPTFDIVVFLTPPRGPVPGG